MASISRATRPATFTSSRVAAALVALGSVPMAHLLSCMHLFGRSFVCSFVHSLTDACSHFFHSFFHSFIHSSIFPSIHPSIYPYIHSYLCTLLPALCQVNTGCSHALARLEFCHSPCHTTGLLLICAELMIPACEHTTCTHMSCCMFPWPVMESKTASK